MGDTAFAAESAVSARPRLRKRPHNLHLCAGGEELLRELRAKQIDPLSIIYEFIKPSVEIGVVATGSIPSGVATEVSDLDIWVLLPSVDAFKSKRPREVAGSMVKYLAIDGVDRVQVALFLDGIEVDVLFIANPAIDRYIQSGGVREIPLADDVQADSAFVNRLANGWTLYGADVVERWRRYYETHHLRMKWMAADFTSAAKNLEDMEAGIGRARGHVPAIGVYCVQRLLRSLLAYSGCYSTSAKWMLRVDRLIRTADPELRDALITGRALVFPTLLDGPEEERAYFERVYAYAGVVRKILSREEGMPDILDSVIHDLDIIL